jgi:hypothetical protein
MSLIRVKHVDFETNFDVLKGIDTLDTNEWLYLGWSRKPISFSRWVVHRIEKILSEKL